ncbi:MAG TPA: PRC-barrel domain-containing protein [Nitrososphaera sp.]|nr:PRC-barrel domain-containing protein [Nitrososphaera sp.]
MKIIGAKVYASDGEDVGEITGVSDEYFTITKKGLIMDEEYRVPVNAILNIESENDSDIPAVMLSLNEEQLKHGSEFTTERPNSGIVSGKVGSELRIPSVKPNIRYEAMPPPKEERAQAPRTGASNQDEYICDMCAAKFEGADELEEHRRSVHKGPVGV